MMAQDKIVLTLDGAPVEAVAPERPAELTAEEQKQVADLAQKIDLGDTGTVLQYGAGTQRKMADFSESALHNVRAKDLGAVGDMITGLVVELRGFSVDGKETGGLFGFFKKSANRLAVLTARYNKAEGNVEKIASILEDHQVQLLKDIAMLDQLYDRNLLNFKELTMYILAGKQKLEQAQTKDLPALQEKAEQSGLPEDAQAARDYANLINRFEKKIHDLQLTRTISIQMAPQIRMIQNNDTLMAEKIQSTLINTIPLWKNQMVLSLGLHHSQQAMRAQREVTDMTNELLRKNAEMLKEGTLETARESERGIVDIETLQHTNQMLIVTLDEVLAIQKQGREKRRAAEGELRRIEDELKNKLLEARG